MYAPVGQCVYCGTKEGPLTREHIIPYALGGTLVLPGATCKEHEKVTSKIERKIARTMYGIQRADSGAPSRRPGEQKKLLKEKKEVSAIARSGEEVTLSVAVEDQPRVPVVVTFEPPGILLGRSVDESSNVEYKLIEPTREEYKKFHDKYGVKQFTMQSPPVDYWSLIRGLAKIAHCYAVAEIGLANFRPVLLPIILGDGVNGTYFVGGFEPREDQDSAPLKIRNIEINGNRLFVVDISLHFFPKIPKYQVVCGFEV